MYSFMLVVTNVYR